MLCFLNEQVGFKKNYKNKRRIHIDKMKVLNSYLQGHTNIICEANTVKEVAFVWKLSDIVADVNTPGSAAPSL